MTMPQPDTEESWPEALATVTECHYESRNTLVLVVGFSVNRHFHIRYNYEVNGELHTGEFYAKRPIPQGTLFPVRFDPEDPKQHTHARQAEPAGIGLIAMALMVSFVLALAVVVLVHGCR